MALPDDATLPRLAVVIDDERAIARIISYLLAELGWTVQAFGDAEAALPFVRERCCRLVVTDIQLPGMSGVQLTQRIREDQVTAPAVVILVSAYAEPFEHAADAFMGKPFDIDEFLEFLRPFAAEAERRL